MKNLSRIFLIILILSSCAKTETTFPERKDIVEAVFASGHVIMDQEYQVTSRAEGYLLESMIEVGDSITANSPLFLLSNEIQSEQVANAYTNYQDAQQKLDTNAPQLSQQRLQVELAKSQLELDEKNMVRYEKLLKKNAVSQMEYDRIKQQHEQSVKNVKIQETAYKDLLKTLELNAINAKSQLTIQKESNADYYLTSSRAGQILALFKKDGELVKRGESIALIGSGEKLVKLFISEEDINDITLNQKVIIRLNTKNEEILEGYVSHIYPSFDEIEQSFVIEARFNRIPESIYHNSQLQANIIIDERLNKMVIPKDYLHPGDSVLQTNGVKKRVEVGSRTPEWIEITGGLELGDELLIHSL